MAMRAIGPMSAPSSSASARSSARSILSSSTSIITPDSVTAGLPAASPTERPQRQARSYRSLAVTTVLLAVIFLIVPLILYWQFKAADEEKQNLLLRSVREPGHVLGQALLPILSPSDPPALPLLGPQLARFPDALPHL